MRPYLSDGFESQSYPDSQNLFTLGRAAIYPTGSWEIPGFEKQASFKMGAFPPPVQKAGDKCYISDHPDIALGKTPSPRILPRRKSSQWVASPEFAVIYSDALPGFFSLQKAKIEMKTRSPRNS